MHLTGGQQPDYLVGAVGVVHYQQPWPGQPVEMRHEIVIAAGLLVDGGRDRPSGSRARSSETYTCSKATGTIGSGSSPCRSTITAPPGNQPRPTAVRARLPGQCGLTHPRHPRHDYPRRRL